MHPIINTIKEKYGNSSDIVTRNINNISYIYLESVSSDDKISDFLNKSIIDISNIKDLYNLLKNNIYCSHIITSSNIDKCCYYLSSGYTCVFINNNNKFIALETKAEINKSFSEATT